eukprot:scaffold5185_cov198-Alexandrium_tamarense.AAC.16
MTSHIEAFLYGVSDHAWASLFGDNSSSASASAWTGRHLADASHGTEAAHGEVDSHADDGHGNTGSVHIAYEDLYASIIFFACIYVGGIFLGPNLANYVPNPVSFVMLGEIGLILLVLEAGIDIDLTTLKLIGSRGLLIAIVGSILPIAIAIAIAFAIGTDTAGAIAAGASFGPTSLGIAMNILRAGKIVNTPVGQLIVSAAVIDDMIALIILSQLGALSGSANVTDIVVPIVSALGFLIGGGYIAVAILPRILEKQFFSRIKKEQHGAAGLALMFLFLFAMMPATYYAKSSFLMGAFLSGLVPIKDFGDWHVIGYGALFTLALLGKLAVGFMVPNFNNSDKFKGLHLRDCLITGCSMAAEGKFAFVIAVFAVDQELISPDLYASIVLAVLVSTIIPPFALRFTISYFNKVAERMLKQAEELERQRAATMDDTFTLTPEEQEKRLREHIQANKIIFLCIQIQCASTWGLIPKIITTLTNLKLEVIDNRSWHPRGVDSTLMTEIFVEDDTFLENEDEETQNKTIEERIQDVTDAMSKSIRQPGAQVKVTRWYPGVLQAIVEEVKSKSSVKKVGASRGSVKDILAMEATKTLETKRNLQIAATKEKSLDEIKKEMGIPVDSTPAKGEDVSPAPAEGVAGLAGVLPPTTTRRRVRQKMRSTPVTGGSLFDDAKPDKSEQVKPQAGGGGVQAQPFSDSSFSGQMAELVVGGEVFNIRIMPQTIQRIRSGYSGELLDDASVQFSSRDVPIEHRLQGFVRTAGLQTITEDVSDTASNHPSEKESDHDSDW